MNGYGSREGIIRDVLFQDVTIRNAGLHGVDKRVGGVERFGFFDSEIINTQAYGIGLVAESARLILSSDGTDQILRHSRLEPGVRQVAIVGSTITRFNAEINDRFAGEGSEHLIRLQGAGNDFRDATVDPNGEDADFRDLDHPDDAADFAARYYIAGNILTGSASQDGSVVPESAITIRGQSKYVSIIANITNVSISVQAQNFDTVSSQEHVLIEGNYFYLDPEDVAASLIRPDNPDAPQDRPIASKIQRASVQISNSASSVVLRNNLFSGIQNSISFNEIIPRAGVLSADPANRDLDDRDDPQFSEFVQAPNNDFTSPFEDIEIFHNSILVFAPEDVAAELPLTPSSDVEKFIANRNSGLAFISIDQVNLTSNNTPVSGFYAGITVGENSFSVDSAVDNLGQFSTSPFVNNRRGDHPIPAHLNEIEFSFVQRDLSGAYLSTLPGSASSARPDQPPSDVRAILLDSFEVAGLFSDGDTLLDGRTATTQIVSPRNFAGFTSEVTGVNFGAFGGTLIDELPPISEGPSDPDPPNEEPVDENPGGETPGGEAPTDAFAPDAFENNQSFADATPLPGAASANSGSFDATLVRQGENDKDFDRFRVELNEGDTLSLALNRTAGNLSQGARLRIVFDTVAGGQNLSNLDAEARGITTNEAFVNHTVQPGQAGTYYIEVRNDTADHDGSAYTLDWNIDRAPAFAPDAFEDNQSFADATPLPGADSANSGSFDATLVRQDGNDKDFDRFRVELNEGDTLSLALNRTAGNLSQGARLRIVFDTAAGGQNLSNLDAEARGITTNEAFVNHTVQPGQAGTYYIEVRNDTADHDGSAYTLDWNIDRVV